MSQNGFEFPLRSDNSSKVGVMFCPQVVPHEACASSFALNFLVAEFANPSSFEWKKCFQTFVLRLWTSEDNIILSLFIL